MAAISGARATGLFEPRAGRRSRSLDEAPVLARRRMRVAVRARRRPNRLGLLLGGIVLTFMLAFFSLAQNVRVSATGYDIDRAIARHDELERGRREVASDIDRLGGAPAIRKQAIDLGLAPLGDPIVLPAR